MIGVFKLCSIGFRPLDGESFSKLGCIVMPEPGEPSFRPLDGESFSKLPFSPGKNQSVLVSVP